jgi:hypothetical protein
MTARRVLIAVALATVATAALVFAAPASFLDAGTWKRLASPGPLSKAHASLEANCSACHTPVAGVEDAGCVSCHANEASLLARQPTAFHAAIADANNCAACHREHSGRNSLRRMDHAAFARMMLRRLEREPRAADASAFLQHLNSHRLNVMNPRITLDDRSEDSLLECGSCHSSSDPHTRVFGDDCAACHATSVWTIPAFAHPSPASTQCAQCHLAPLSHYHEHFAMMSKPIAGVEHAEPEDCFLCHQTTSWNDIRAVGIYDHH